MIEGVKVFFFGNFKCGFVLRVVRTPTGFVWASTSVGWTPLWCSSMSSQRIISVAILAHNHHRHWYALANLWNFFMRRYGRVLGWRERKIYYKLGISLSVTWFIVDPSLFLLANMWLSPNPLDRLTQPVNVLSHVLHLSVCLNLDLCSFIDSPLSMLIQRLISPI